MVKSSSILFLVFFPLAALGFAEGILSSLAATARELWKGLLIVMARNPKRRCSLCYEECDGCTITENGICVVITRLNY